MKMNARKIADKGGFTLTEVLIGMAILTIAIVSATNLLTGLMHSNKAIVENLQAYYLAQEGIELARNARDTNWENGRDWKDVIDNVELVSVDVSLDGVSRTVVASEILDDDDDVVIDDAVLVTSTVTWDDGELSLDTILTDWQ